MTRTARVAMRIGRLALGLVLLAFLAATIPFGQIIEQQERVEAAAAELARLENENLFLADEVVALQTPAEIERMARAKLGYVMPGETGFVVLEPDPDVTIATESPARPSTGEPSAWWRSLWNFLTGADVS
ncbi:MAG TPA: septum formation initiator family protein [Acidimicrobiia bacterium]|jgi:cell division protein FtsB|nr:septum formation initiator family protein [Acidimicrobiia bacterium]